MCRFSEIGDVSLDFIKNLQKICENLPPLAAIPLLNYKANVNLKTTLFCGEKRLQDRFSKRRTQKGGTVKLCKPPQ
jgi:hypothetical protein